jgi:dipeptidyl aminopeptidase/acylaminoacyl peptidase
MALSPDGTRLVATVTALDHEGTKWVNALWAIDPTGAAAALRLTRSAKGEGGPAFLPNGDVLFVSERPDPERKPDDDERAALWLLPASGGEARIVLTRPGGVDAVLTADRADTVAVRAATLPGEAGEDERRRKERKDAGVQAILHEDRRLRYWDHDLGPDLPRWFATASGGDTDSPPVDLTPEVGLELVETSADLSPDGHTLVTSWWVGDGRGGYREQLMTVDTAGGQYRVLVGDDGVDYSAPAVAPDGESVACLRNQHGAYESPEDVTLWLVPSDGGQGRDLTPDLDLWPVEVIWGNDASVLFFVADERGHAPIFRLDLNTGNVTRLTASGAHASLSVSPDGAVLYAVRSAVSEAPAPVRYDARAPDQLPTRLRGPEGAAPGVPGTLTEVTTQAADATALRAWLALPEDASDTSPAPLVVWIHGGPLASWNSWNWRWCPWLLAAQGYAVLLPDPAFSTGYGRGHVARGWGQWAGTPYSDVLALTDAALARPDLDAERTAAMGGSYGGYLSNWVAGHTDRFRAIVTHASVWSLPQFGATTDSPWFWRREFGDPRTQPERYEAWSPDRFGDGVKTPMLVIHGDKDYRVPIGEALHLWDDLTERGVDAKFLHFPAENHWILSPGNARVWYETVLAFLDHHVLGKDWVRPPLL